MHRITRLGLALLASGTVAHLAHAEPLQLAQHPPRLSREPAPNVVISIDNSSSLGSDGLRDLKLGLKAAFSNERLDDGRIRLAWQAMHGCHGLPGSVAACQGHNAMRPLRGDHRQRFMSWTHALELGKGTPAHSVVDAAGQYLSALNLGIDSPWAADPGIQEEPVLACRKAYHLFLSDGAWGHASSKGVDTAGPNHLRIARGDNPDNTPTRLPDGTDYPGPPSQTRLYRDLWGSSGWSSGSFAGHEDVGHIYAAPVVDDTGRSEQIVKLNNGRWAVVMGNGVNSINERPVLLIQYLDGDRSLLRLVAHSEEKQSNGLSAPRLIDVNGDGKMDIAYAGDLKGQLWKFNLSGNSDADWGVSVWNGSGDTCRDATSCEPFFVASDNATPARRQPITAAPLWLAHPLGGIQLMFGTGRHLQTSDAADTQVQTIYSLWDKSGFAQRDGRLTLLDAARIRDTDTRQVLVQQEVLGTTPRRESPSDAATSTPELSYTSEKTVPYSRGDNASGPRGWYLDLPRERERVLQAPVYFEGQKAVITSTAPADVNAAESCDAGIVEDSHWLTVLNMISGWPSATPIFALPGVTGGAQRANRVSVKASEFITLPGAGNRLDLISVRNGEGCIERACTDKATLLGSGGPGVRMDWREVLR